MRKTQLLLAGAAALGLILAGSAGSAQQQPGPGKMFRKIDQNRDGVITREEARAAQARRFARLDGDGDGTITREEFQAMANRHFARFDLDGDGQVTHEEMRRAKRDHQQRQAD